MRWLLLTGGDRTNALLAIVVSGSHPRRRPAGQPRGTPRRPALDADHRLVRRVRLRAGPVARARACTKREAIRGSTRLVAAGLRGEIERDLGRPHRRPVPPGRAGRRARPGAPIPGSRTPASRSATSTASSPSAGSTNTTSCGGRAAGALDLAGLDVRADPVLGPVAAAAVDRAPPRVTRFIDFAPGEPPLPDLRPGVRRRRAARHRRRDGRRQRMVRVAGEGPLSPTTRSSSSSGYAGRDGPGRRRRPPAATGRASRRSASPTPNGRCG